MFNFFSSRKLSFCLSFFTDKHFHLHCKLLQIVSQDGLYLVANEPEIIAGYSKAILTPNGGEFPRLYNKVVRNVVIQSNWLCAL